MDADLRRTHTGREGERERERTPAKEHQGKAFSTKSHQD
jgi:hypothetical protein